LYGLRPLLFKIQTAAPAPAGKLRQRLRKTLGGAGRLQTRFF
jgi:hypothetical protein